MESPKVFISYSHDSEEHMGRVFELSERLIADGVDSQIDQYEISPLGGWPRWTRNQIKDSDYVLVVCTEKYERRYEGTEVPGTGAGAKWEGAIITQQLYESEGGAHKFIPVAFTREDANRIPVELRGSTRYVLDSEEGYGDLYRHITGQPKAVKGKLGELKKLPPRERKQGFSAKARVDEPVRPKVEGRDETQPSARRLSSLVLIRTPDGSHIYVEAERVQAGETVQMSLLPADSREASAVDSLSRFVRGNPVGLAFGSKALYARVSSVTHVFEGGREVWNVELAPDQDRYRYGYSEINLSGVSADEIAELRARRIFLDEKLLGPTGAYRGVMGSYNQELLEHSVQGRDGGIQVKESPFPQLYSGMKGDPEAFVAKSRLYALLLLVLTNTVESVQQLEMRMSGPDELSVRFEGRRAAQASNRDPYVIKVKGVCKLAEED
jgi:SEFIR domain